jgi:hypothetical protein
LLKIFSQEAEREITTASEFAAEEEAKNRDFVELCEEFESLESRINMKSSHIQQIKFEICGETYHRGEQYEEFGVEPTQEAITKVGLSKEEVEK